jgi:AraC-like DNA-binding protein
MNKGMGNERVVSFTEFLHELQKELKFHQNWGTSYRQKTAELSLEVANKVGAVAPFLERDVAKQTVSRLLPDLDRHRLEDVAKMLHVIAKELHMNANLSDEVKAYVQQKRQHRKSLSSRKNKRTEN